MNSNSSEYDTEQINQNKEKRNITKTNKPKKIDHTFKVVLIGDSGVGKSCILLRFADDQFKEHFYATVGVDFRFKNFLVDEKNIKLQIVLYLYPL